MTNIIEVGELIEVLDLDGGVQGIAGTAATIEIGNVTSGDTPSVTNVGTTTAAILDFVLEKGDQGEQGYAPLMQYSEDGVSWHDDYVGTDLYIHFSMDNGATWGDTIALAVYAMTSIHTLDPTVNQDDITKEHALAWWISYFDGAEATIRVLRGTHQVTADMTIPENICLKFDKGAILEVADTKTLTINGAIEAGLWQIFSGDGVIAGTPKVESIYLEWFGAKGDGVTDDTAAIQAAIDSVANNSTVLIPCNHTFACNNVNISKPVKFVGTGGFKKNNQANYLFNIDMGVDYSGQTIEFNNITIDGDQQGVVGQYDIYAKNCGTLIFNGTKFKNPSKSSTFTDENIENLSYYRCHFSDGMYFSGATAASATFHITNMAATQLDIKECVFKTNIIFDGGDGTGKGVLRAAPIACFSENAINANIQGNRSINAGHIDLYSVNNHCLIDGNTFIECHQPAIKVQECAFFTVSGNMIKNNKCLWTAPMIIGPYVRAGTYGSIERGQANGIIANNTIDGSPTFGMSIGGYRLDAAVLSRDGTLTQDDLLANGYIITGNVIKNVQGLGLTLGLCTNCIISNNIIEKWGLSQSVGATTAIRVVEGRGYNKINGNIIIGDETPSSGTGISFTSDFSVSVITGSYIDIQDNYVANISGYSVFVYLAETAIIKENTLSTSSAAQRTRVQTVTNATVLNNYGYDRTNGNYSYAADVTNLISDAQGRIKKEYYAATAPSTGTFVLGDIVWNITPTANGYMGWVCVTAGTPGTWKGFGLIQA